jgi:tellurite resistance protein
MATDELKNAIKQIIEDHVVTFKEFEQVMGIAEADGRIDSEERALLRELHKMMIEKMIKRAPDA